MRGTSLLASIAAIGISASLAQGVSLAGPSESVGSSITLLYQNNLNWTDDANHAGYLLLESPLSYADASKACINLGEQLLSATGAKASQNDLVPQLQYTTYRGDFSLGQGFWLADGTVRLGVNALLIAPSAAHTGQQPALCTQSSKGTTNGTSIASAENEVSVTSAASGNVFTGYRDLKSFRFLGVPYSNNPARFQYSSVSTQKNAQVSATKFGAQCFQNGGAAYSEDCLFLNVFTPHLPVVSDAPRKLRPVVVWIHGGAFTSGTGSDLTFDGGNMASRGDIVVVTINYRLSTLGFLAIPGTNITGNYGIGDQITALQWVQSNIQAFGGDPSKVTIWGQSAGAGSVRALLSSPKARGLFSAGIPGSNLAGYDRATTYSLYYTPAEEYAAAGQAILNATGCTGADPTACLRTVPPATLVTLPTVAQYIVVDGAYIVASRLNVTDVHAPGAAARVPVLWGTTADDGAAFIGYPAASAGRADAVYSVLYQDPDVAAAVLANTSLFPTPTTGNVTLDLFNLTARIATDVELRCLDQATIHSAVRHGAFPTAYYYQFDRSYQLPGYNPNAPVCDAPITATHPLGDPRLPYFKCHSGDLYFEFGTFGQFALPFRDELDVPFAQLVQDYWTAFVRTHDPNPDPLYLAARGYAATARAVASSGRWVPVSAAADTLRRLDYPPRQSGFLEVEQCAVLGLPIDYYETYNARNSISRATLNRG